MQNSPVQQKQQQNRRRSRLVQLFARLLCLGALELADTLGNNTLDQPPSPILPVDE
jgi:hypothetical protein